MPDFHAYHEALTDELHALKSRVRHLVRNWGTDGEYKEAALRSVLRRHLPESLVVGRGFIVTQEGSSSQIDILIVDGSKPTLFRDGDLLFVTPDCVRAVIEVKTTLRDSTRLDDCTIKLAEVGKLCQRHRQGSPWLGVFCYEQSLEDPELLLDAVEVAYRRTNVAINSLAYGKDRFVRFWQEDEVERGDNSLFASHGKWRAYDLTRLASAYFVGNVVDALSGLSQQNSAFAWYPLSDGKRIHRIGERLI